MRQESGGRLESASGSLTTSWVGAMGLMQVMPQTYDMLRRRYSLGDDAYEPHDNIMAGAGLYPRDVRPFRLAELPGRLQCRPGIGWMRIWPAAPCCRRRRSITWPVSRHAWAPSWPAPHRARVCRRHYAATLPARSAAMPVETASAGGDTADRAYAGGGMSGMTYYSSDRWDVAAANAAPATAPEPAPITTSTSLPPPVAPVRYASLPAPALMQMPMQPVAANAPVVVASAASSRPSLFARAQAAELPIRPTVTPAAALVPVTAPGSARNGWGIQIGAFPDPATSQAAVQAARSAAGRAVGGNPAGGDAGRTQWRYAVSGAAGGIERG